MMDMILLEKGESYDALKKNIVIFICTFDPFGQGRHIYTFENGCVEDPSIRLNDESTKIFLNTKGVMDDIPRPLSMFLDYIETGRALDEYTKELDAAVAEVRTDEKWRKPIMTWEMYISDRENAAKKEGMEEGIKEGSANTARLMAYLAQNGRYDDIIKAAEDENYMQMLFEEFQK